MSRDERTLRGLVRAADANNITVDPYFISWLGDAVRHWPCPIEKDA
jgi:hypothetical protein